MTEKPDPWPPQALLTIFELLDDAARMIFIFVIYPAALYWILSGVAHWLGRI